MIIDLFMTIELSSAIEAIFMTLGAYLADVVN